MGEPGYRPMQALAHRRAMMNKNLWKGLPPLPPQQYLVLTMLAEGLLNKQIAYELDVTEATIKAHMTAIFRKLNVRSRTQAVLAISKLNLESPDQST